MPPRKPTGPKVDAAAELARRLMAPIEPDINTISAEQFVEDPEYCDVPISPAQRALIRAAEGLPVTHLTPDELEYYLGTRGPFVPPRRPRKVLPRSGRRSGKSLIADILALIRGALTCRLRRPPEPHEKPGRDGLVGVRPGELVRGPIVTPRVRQALATFALVAATLESSPRLKKYIHKVGAESLEIKRDDGQIVTICVLAASPRGTNLRGGWFVGVVFDEADFFGEQDASVTLDDQVKAIQPALLPDGQMWFPSSPWEESGDFHKMHSGAFGNPGETVSFHSSTQNMNPICDIAQIEADRLKDPDFVSREYDAVPMIAGGDQFFPEAAIVASCIRDQVQLEPNGAPHWFGADPGLRKNSATLAGARANGGKAELAYTEELIPQKKTPEQIAEDRKRGVPPGLAPSIVFKSFAQTALNYKATCVRGDQYYEDSAIEHMPQVSNARGDSVYYDTFVDNADSTADIMTKLRSLMLEGNAIMPRNPRLMQQLRDTKSKKGPSGKIHVVLPRTGAAHGDLLKAVALAMVQVPLDSDWQDQGAVGGGSRRWGGFGSRRG
ncbi:MAG: hypothetical protein HOW73_20500 [Polyangiaceae bacterium]|nr:hypothetical protein [Polyangiaceae bacterium]